MAVLSQSSLIGTVAPSPAGPAANGLRDLRTVPTVDRSLLTQVLRFTFRHKDFVFASAREYGDVFHMKGTVTGGPIITSHPDHVKSIFTAPPELVPTLTTESPLAPIVGPHAVLTTNGGRHLAQRKMLLPPFHGKSVANYQAVIEAATARELDGWKTGEVLNMSLAMQALTLEVILAGVFGVGREPTRKEKILKRAITAILEASTTKVAQLGELIQVGRTEAFGGLALVLKAFDKTVYDVITERRATLAVDGADSRDDVLSLLLAATDEDGNPLTDHELRDQLVSLLLAGHETTANTIAWAFERLTRSPQAYNDLRDAARSGNAEQSAAMTERVINEAMRSRPVIPIVGRRPRVDWQLGDYGVPAGTGVAMSILLVHHREDLYPRAAEFLPSRWEGHKPGTYTWIPFGGGTRRCLGAALAMAELRHVIPEIARRFDLAPDRAQAEAPLHRNVTMIPARGGLVQV
ncbi:MAG: cytochrome P450, partial [Solirubrobacteraceae bacterium]|nr:cytochrome P450 [Solirubrobacteraceae bacterium]